VDPDYGGQWRKQAGLAQLVERFSCKEDVVGSSPTPGSSLRILVVTNAYPAPERPAYGIYVARLVGALESDGHEVVLAASSEQGGGWRTLRKYARLAWSARAAARKHRPDVVWGHYLVPTGTIARRAARSAGVPYALTAHGTDVANAERSPRIRKATLRAVGDACAVFAVSDQLGARIEAIAGPLGERLHVISAGVDLDAFADGDAEVAAAALGWETDGPRVVHVGNLVPAKNLVRLLEAFAIARAEWGGGSLALVGDGPLRAELEARAAELGLSGAVSFAGAVAPVDVPRWLRASDVACLVSEREGFGLVAIEALAAGRPVVVARSVPAAAAIADGVTGALCAADDVAGIASALARAAALTPGDAARTAAEPYSLTLETARAVSVLERCTR
jgi:glycosyltransferase involved in cell wall biosynthesis